MTENNPFDRAIDLLLEDASPRSELDELSPEDRRLVAMAQRLRGVNPPAPDPDYLESVRRRIAPRAGISRRQAFVGALGGLAAGLLAGFGVERAVTSSSPPPAPEQAMPLVGPHGQWIRVASVADVPPGSVKPFNTGAVQGFLIHENGELRALSRICTHMGCVLNYDEGSSLYGTGVESFVCPCHGAAFDLNGRLRSRNYKVQSLPPLPKIKVRVNGESVEVWGV